MSWRSIALGLLVLACAGIALLGIGVVAVPLIPAELDATYKQIALANDPPAPYLSMEAIDAVRYVQDWSRPTDQSISQLASMFAYCWDEVQDKKSITRCRRRSISQVADMLGFSADEKQLAHIYHDELNELNRQ